MQPACSGSADRRAGPEAQPLPKRQSKFELVIIGDLGNVQQGRDEMEVLFTLLAERYERGSVTLASNLPFSQ